MTWPYRFDRRKAVVPNDYLVEDLHKSIPHRFGLRGSTPNPTMYKGKNEEDTRFV
jgi:hypothetical protein